MRLASPIMTARKLPAIMWLHDRARLAGQDSISSWCPDPEPAVRTATPVLAAAMLLVHQAPRDVPSALQPQLQSYQVNQGWHVMAAILLHTTFLRCQAQI